MTDLPYLDAQAAVNHVERAMIDLACDQCAPRRPEGINDALRAYWTSGTGRFASELWLEPSSPPRARPNATLMEMVSQRLLRSTQGGRMPAVEVLLNTQLVSEMIDQGNLSGVKDAMERLMYRIVPYWNISLPRMRKNIGDVIDARWEFDYISENKPALPADKQITSSLMQEINDEAVAGKNISM